jgi:Cu+-exporting ATPase
VGSEAQYTTICVPVEGMSCASCVVRVEKALKRVEGVDHVAVNLGTEKATIRFDRRKAGMSQLRASVEEAGYRLGDESTDQQEADRQFAAVQGLRHDLVVSAILTLPIVALSMASMTEWFRTVHPLSSEALDWILLALTTPLLVFPGRRFFVGLAGAIRYRSPDMNTLVAVGTGSAYLYSTAVVLIPSLLRATTGHAGVYFDTTATIITLILLGKYLERRARSRASEAIRGLLALQPPRARVVRHGAQIEVDVADVQTHDLIVIRPGERVPVDGVIEKGSTTVDESMVTGESLPAEKNVGDKLVGGTLNRNGSVDMRATAVGSDTVLAQITRLVEEAQGSKAPIQALADRIAGVFVPVIIGIAVIAFVAWFVVLAAPFTNALTAFIAVLIIACPCALGLATPAAIMVGTGNAAAHGIFLRNIESLERVREIDTLVLDKTGTITEGKPVVTDVVSIPGTERGELLRLAGGVEALSEHPLAEAIVAEAKITGGKVPGVQRFQSLTGHGVSAEVEGNTILVGNAELMENMHINTGRFRGQVSGLAAAGKTVFYVARGKQLAGIIAVADRIKPTAADAVAKLRKRGIDVFMVTGDQERTARTVAEQAGIDRVVAGVLPAGKAELVKNLQAQGRRVAVVGDGINDAPALAVSDVGLAIGTGADVAVEAADVTLMNGDPATIPLALDISDRTMRTIRQNLFWAFIYNVVGIPLAAAGLLNPAIAAAAMACSSVSVVGNSLRLRNRSPR